jgi:hypothetical protein
VNCFGCDQPPLVRGTLLFSRLVRVFSYVKEDDQTRFHARNESCGPSETLSTILRKSTCVYPILPKFGAKIAPVFNGWGGM